VPGAVEGARAQLLSAALAAHFLKRVLKVTAKTLFSNPSIIRRVRPNFVEFFLRSVTTHLQSKFRAVQDTCSSHIYIYIYISTSLKYVPCQVLFIHRYSGNMPLATAATISSSYLLSTVNMIYALHLCRDLPDPAIGLPYPGVLVFAVGIAGNLYHHYLLSRLRSGSSGGDKGHRIPRGGLFELVTCPHYLFEIIGLFGFAMISQTTPWPLALLRTSPAGAAPPGGGISPSSRCEI
jgi:hypothetical protein